MLSLVVHKNTVFVLFDIVHEPIFGSNIAIVDEFSARIGGFAS